MQPRPALSEQLQRAFTFENLWRKRSFTERFLLTSWVMIIALMPFHAFISTWGGSTIGPLEVWKSWKEILLLVCLVVSLPYLIRQGRLKRFFADKLVWLVFAYAAIHLIAWAAFRPDRDAAIAGVLMNLRFLGIFLLSGVLLTFIKPTQLLRLSVLVVFLGAAGVLLFGMWQATILPDDFLRHFGYGKDTIAPYTTLDNNHQFIRLQSTLRGPNPLGQYLIIVGLLLLAAWRKGRELFVAGWLLMATLLLVTTNSRSAWIGMAVALGVFGYLRLTNPKIRQAVMGVAGGIAISGVLLIAWALPSSTFLQQTVLHNKAGDTDAGSTVEHFRAAERSLERIATHPLGQGPGAVGPASFYGPQSRIPENYYLQITEEVGVIGIALFIAINAMVVQRLWRRRHNRWATVWIASFAGISVVNLFLHGWADETTALIWWAIAGVLICISDTPVDSGTASAKRQRPSFREILKLASEVSASPSKGRRNK